MTLLLAIFSLLLSLAALIACLRAFCVLRKEIERLRADHQRLDTQVNPQNYAQRHNLEGNPWARAMEGSRIRVKDIREIYMRIRHPFPVKPPDNPPAATVRK